MSKPVICFDLFGTLISAPSGTPSYEDLFEAAGCHKEHVQAYVRRRFMAGPVPYGSYLDMAKALCYVMPLLMDLDPKEVARIWEAENQALQWLPRMKEMIDRRVIKGHYVLVTNITQAALAEPFIQEVIGQFDEVYLSCRELCAKPDPYVWQKIMHRHPDATQYHMYGDSELSDLAVPFKMGWIVSNPRDWTDPDDICHQEYTNEDGQLQEAVSVGHVHPRR